MQTIQLLLQLFDDNLHAKWETLNDVVKGIGEEEAQWQAPCYAAVERDPNCPPPGTILWQLDHIAGCNRHYVEVLRHRPAKDFPARPPTPPPATMAAAVEELRASHAALHVEIAKIKAEDLGSPCGHGSANVGDFLSGCLRHEIWHGGQIALIRRLYSTRER